MLRRLCGGVLALGLAMALAQWLHAQQPVEARRASALAGETWYKLLMAQDTIGYLHTNVRRDFNGYWWFESLMHFSLDENPPVSISETLKFNPLPPYGLTSAEHWSNRTGVPTKGLVVEASADGFRLSFRRGDSVSSGQREWDFSMGDYLAVESWLVQEQPAKGARFRLTMLDFAAAAMTKKTFAVVEKNAVGYRLASAAPLQPTEIQLDQHFKPVELSMSGLFQLQRTTSVDALKARTPLNRTDHRVALDRPLPDHKDIQHLVLAAAGDHNLSRVWPWAWRGLNGWRLTLKANPVSVDDDPAKALHETLDYPVSHADVAALAQRAVDGTDDQADQLAALVAFVHGHIDYAPDAAPTSVLETIATRSGDCTEYADLLTTLARSLGWPARTVVGLAYSVRGEPALVFHAWNEVALDGVWRSVDPTWNQIRVDATHIPVLGGQAALLRLLQGEDRLRFKVQSVRHD